MGCQDQTGDVEMKATGWLAGWLAGVGGDIGSVKGDPSAGFIRSRLYIADASPADSGPYTCCYHNITCGEVAVHVLAGEWMDATTEATIG
ncbi:hypothetical protein Pmani_037233 [Petrolisthes manimaculis]|uniref:Ig-like domain-containing protein n=1 Tax=Petrolisthes manimaculis TaxID=1843537 RepID=A0AAE1NHN3_9EUCA|nr:hypothetical protein Pmani_037233 [Petrolisthes manimaculis]